MATPCRILLWADAEHEPLVREVIEHSAIELVGVGSDSSVAAATLSSSFGVERCGDLRQSMQQTDCDLLWIAAPIILDPDTLRLIAHLQRKVLCSEPQPALAREHQHAIQERSFVRTGPLMRHSPGFRAAADALADAGAVEAMNVCVRCRRAEGTLFARLFDAMDVVEMLCGEAVAIDAALAGPAGAAPGAVPEAVTSLHGHVTANIRFSEQCCASIFASDCSGGWFRGVTIMTENGCFRVTDQQMMWMDRAEGVIDSSDVSEVAFLPGALIADTIERWHAGRDHTESLADPAQLLAMCEATRLSCRTGEGEAPRTMLRMLSRP